MYERSEGQSNPPSSQIHNHLAALLNPQIQQTKITKLEESNTRLKKRIAEKERQISFLIGQTGIKLDEIPSPEEFKILKFQQLKLETEVHDNTNQATEGASDGFVVLN